MARLILLVLLALVSDSFAFKPFIKISVKWSSDGNGKKSFELGIEFNIRGRRDTLDIDAPTDPNMPTKFFHFIDLNNDDQLDRAEWALAGGKQDEFSAILENLDADGDEMISYQEFHAIHLLPSAHLFVANFLDAKDEVAEKNDNENSPGI